MTRIHVPYYAQPNRFKAIDHGLFHVEGKGYDRIGEVLPFRLAGR